MRGGTLIGIFVGLVLGLAVAAGIAYFLGKSGLTGSSAMPGTQMLVQAACRTAFPDFHRSS